MNYSNMVILTPSKNKRYVLTREFQQHNTLFDFLSLSLCLWTLKHFKAVLQASKQFMYMAEWQGDPAESFQSDTSNLRTTWAKTWHWSTQRSQTYFEMQPRACAKKNVETLLHLATIHNSASCLNRLYCLYIVLYVRIFCEQSHFWEFSKQN